MPTVLDCGRDCGQESERARWSAVCLSERAWLTSEGCCGQPHLQGLRCRVSPCWRRVVGLDCWQGPGWYQSPGQQSKKKAPLLQHDALGRVHENAKPDNNRIVPNPIFARIGKASVSPLARVPREWLDGHSLQQVDDAAWPAARQVNRNGWQKEKETPAVQKSHPAHSWLPSHLCASTRHQSVPPYLPRQDGIDFIS